MDEIREQAFERDRVLDCRRIHLLQDFGCTVQAKPLLRQSAAKTSQLAAQLGRTDKTLKHQTQSRYARSQRTGPKTIPPLSQEGWGTFGRQQFAEAFLADNHERFSE